MIQHKQNAQAFVGFGMFGPNPLDMGCERYKMDGYGM